MNGIGKISGAMTTVVNRYLPDPLIFAMLLTLIMFCIGFLFTPHSPLEIGNMWGDGFWNLLAFGMQMALIIVTGHALASTPLVRSLLRDTASLAKTPVQGVMLVSFFGLIACAINWGFGLIVGAMFAKEVARRVKGSDYPLLIACAYMGFLSWGGGLSGSMPLLAATPGNPMEHLTGGIIPIGQTMFAGFNIFAMAALLVVIPLVAGMMMPKAEQVHKINAELLQEDPDYQRKLPLNASVAEKLEESRILTFIISLLAIVYLVMYFWKNGFNITINNVNMIFLIAGLLLHKTPMAYMRAFSAGTRSCAGVLIQFPFYAGIQLMMEHSGFGGMITNFFVDISTKNTFPVMAFISSAIVNFAVPSGGGHWVIQGPFVIPAAQQLGADLGKATMAIAYGEQCGNMAQPFWALPALAIAGLSVRDIMGYCITALIFSAIIFIVALSFF
jgi:short-chain fatty acids transporter